jgi:hypothetical protein
MALESILVAFVTILIGAAFCFGGFKWFMILLPVWGFITGFSMGAYGVSSIFGESLLSMAVIIVAGAIIGLIFAVIAYLFFPVAIILMGASLGYFVGWTVIVSLGFEPGLIPALVGLVVAIVVALLAIRFHLPKFVIIVSTSLLGSIAIIIGIMLLIGDVSLQGGLQGGLQELARYLIEASTAWSILWIALGAVGFIVQLHRAKAYEMDSQSI